MMCHNDVASLTAPVVCKAQYYYVDFYTVYTVVFVYCLHQCGIIVFEELPCCGQDEGDNYGLFIAGFSCKYSSQSFLLFFEDGITYD